MLHSDADKISLNGKIFFGSHSLLRREMQDLFLHLRSTTNHVHVDSKHKKSQVNSFFVFCYRYMMQKPFWTYYTTHPASNAFRNSYFAGAPPSASIQSLFNWSEVYKMISDRPRKLTKSFKSKYRIVLITNNINCIKCTVFVIMFLLI